MERSKYFRRIEFNGDCLLNRNLLVALHRLHVFNVPFENLDIQYGRPLSLEPEYLFNKIVCNNRGGFCYELNLLFYELLRDIGFSTNLIDARIYDTDMQVGPAFDHMAIVVEHDGLWLADVGFGDLFLEPLKITEGDIQNDGRNFFRIDRTGDDEYTLLMSHDKRNFVRKYSFSLEPRSRSGFEHICIEKQTNADSYFVKNMVCTKPTSHGRITLFNNKFIVKVGSDKFEQTISSEDQCQRILKEKFCIHLDREFNINRVSRATF